MIRGARAPGRGSEPPSHAIAASPSFLILADQEKEQRVIGTRREVQFADLQRPWYMVFFCQ